MFTNQNNFHLQKSVCDFESPIKSHKQNLERGWEEHFLWHFQMSSPNFVCDFWLEIRNHKRIFEDESYFDLWTFFSAKFLEKSSSTMHKWGLKFYNWHNSCFLTKLGMSIWASTNPNEHIPHGLFHLLSPYLYKEIVYTSFWTHIIRDYLFCEKWNLNKWNKWALSLKFQETLK